MSPAVETSEGNKRPALICDFFAKGWCIKGNSCRFRHIKDLDQQIVSSVAASQNSEPQYGEGNSYIFGKYIYQSTFFLFTL